MVEEHSIKEYIEGLKKNSMKPNKNKLLNFHENETEMEIKSTMRSQISIVFLSDFKFK